MVYFGARGRIWTYTSWLLKPLTLPLVYTGKQFHGGGRRNCTFSVRLMKSSGFACAYRHWLRVMELHHELEFMRLNGSLSPSTPQYYYVGTVQSITLYHIVSLTSCRLGILIHNWSCEWGIEPLLPLFTPVCSNTPLPDLPTKQPGIEPDPPSLLVSLGGVEPPSVSGSH